MTLARRVTAEAVGTALLLASVVGSGIMGERLAGGNMAVALLANTIATGAALVALILTFGPISGAHFNPAVTLADASQGGIRWRDVPAYLAAQFVGAFAGRGCRAFHVWRAAVWPLPDMLAAGGGQLFSEFVATFGLLSRHLGMRAPAIVCGSVRGRSVHHERLLVHCIHVVRESGGNVGARLHQYLFRHPPS